jgi:hypothetical protein
MGFYLPTFKVAALLIAAAFAIAFLPEIRRAWRRWRRGRR